MIKRYAAAAAFAAVAVLFANAEEKTPALVKASARDIPVAGQADVLVVGGSSGGVSAALAAARQGAKVLLITDRNYLGDDICGTYRLWLEEGEQANLPLARDLFRDSSAKEGVHFTYSADHPASGKHLDSTPPSKLASCGTVSAMSDCVEFDGDVALTLDLGRPLLLESVTANAFQQERMHKVSNLTVLGSIDGQQWVQIADVLNRQTPDENRAVALSVPLTGTARYLKLQYRKAEGAQRMLLSRIIVKAGDPQNQTAFSCPTPMHIKRTLEQALLAAKVNFLFASYPSQVLFDKDGKPAGIVMANRAGRQAVFAKIIIDATPRATVARMAGAQFEPYPAGRQVFSRIVVGGPKMAGPNVKSVRSLPVELPIRQTKGTINSYEYTLEVDMKDGSWSSFANAEQVARDATWTTGQIDSSESLFQVPPDPMKSRQAMKGDWSSAASATLDAFRPQSLPHLYVLGGCADISRPAAAKLLRPAALMEMGDRIGAAAAAEAASIEPVTQALPAVTGGKPTVAGDLKELLTGLRPTQKGLPVIHVPEGTLPVLGRYDVVVVGAGTGGAPAGISAARTGAKTLVVEYLHEQGGVGTLGLIGIYYFGNQIGFTDELNNGLKAMGPGALATEGDKQGRAWNLDWKMEWYRRELRKAGGEFWMHSIGCGAIVDDGKVKGIAVATPQGWGIVLAKVVVDSTGNSDVAIAAGADYVFTSAETMAMQGTGLPFRNIYDLNSKSRFYTNTDYTYADESDLIDVWRLFLRARQKFSTSYDLGQLVDSRERRRIVGDYTISPTDIFGARTYDDPICYSKSNFDSHGFSIHPLFLLQLPSKASLNAYVPYRSLLPRNLEGVIVTGLGISAHRDAMPIIRMEADIQNMGYAAGRAAAMAAKADCGLRQIDIKALRSHLVEKGNLPAEVLTQKDNFAVPPQRITQAVEAVQKDYTDLPMVLAHWDEARPLLRKAYANTTKPESRLIDAHILGMMGDATGADTLLAKVSSTPDKDWAQHGPKFGSYLSEMDICMIALGRTHDPRAAAPIIAKLKQLDASNEFSHYRAVAMALEELRDPAAAKPLADMLSLPGMTGYNVPMELVRQIDPEYPKEREPALREIILARALYRCGDYNGVGYRILKNYEADVRGVYSRHAQAVLNEKPAASGTPAQEK